MSRKHTVLPNTGGSYIRQSKGLKRVEEPTRETAALPRETPVETPVEQPVKETGK